jgi:hypothetical protein
MRLRARNDASRRRGPRAYRVDTVHMSRPGPRTIAAFHVAPEKAGTFRCGDTGIGEAAAATVVQVEQHVAVDRFGSPY